MEKTERELYLKRNYGRVSLALASRETGLQRNEIRRKWRELKYNPKFVDTTITENDYAGTYVFIPSLRARVKIRKGHSVKQYLAKLESHKNLMRGHKPRG